MAHRIFDLVSLVVLFICLVKAVRSFLVSDILCVVAECIAAEWRRLWTALKRARERRLQEPVVSAAEVRSLAGAQFLGD